MAKTYYAKQYGAIGDLLCVICRKAPLFQIACLSAAPPADDPLETRSALRRNCIMKTAFLILGIVMTLIGLVWIGQGSGYFPYPASSFMISQKPWITYGAGLALVGLFVMGFARSKS